ncbi:bifunctional alpha,alpha-trehalose-phosphate synthase (UDP-forming)/trehalose-phosphatase [Bacteroidota bacterium]
MERLLMVSNLLPYEVDKENTKIDIYPREGGFASGLNVFYDSQNCYWIGWPGIEERILTDQEKKIIRIRLFENNCFPLYFGSHEVNIDFHNFSEKTIYPLFHYMLQNAVFDNDTWKKYKKVNQQYADVIFNIANENDRIWIHDYHLMLLPALIREKLPNISIGFFLHIPFPSYEIFRLLPWRKDMLEGMLGADLIGFHTYDYERHFMSCVRRLLGYDTVFNRIRLDERVVKADAFPMGVDFNKFQKHAEKIINRPKEKLSDIQKEINHFTSDDKYKKVILSIDRLDESKGIGKRLEAFEYFLNKYPQYLEKVIFILVVMPTAEDDENYFRLKSEVDELVGKINGNYGVIRWTPVWYIYRSLPLDTLIELYTLSDIALIMPLRDGMNLYAKEYIASKVNKKGVLILSEMAGASKEMHESMVINPNNFDDLADSIGLAIEMPEEDQEERITEMQKRLQNFDEEKWASYFIKSLKDVKKLQETNLTKKVNDTLETSIVKTYSKAKKRIIFLDYDGTLTGFRKDPLDAKPDKELYQILKALTENSKNTVTIISGRDKDILSEWFDNTWKLNFIAEHGVWTKNPGEGWNMTELIKGEWMDIVRPYIEFYVDRTPGSFIEEKNYSLVWHYRKADPDLGILRSWELKDELMNLVSNLNLEIMDGDKVIEIKNAGVNKGRGALNKIGNIKYDFIFGIGDDWTDEYLFDALPAEAITIKVGVKNTKAKYYVEGTENVRVLLSKFAEN